MVVFVVVVVLVVRSPLVVGACNVLAGVGIACVPGLLYVIVVVVLVLPVDVTEDMCLRACQDRRYGFRDKLFHGEFVMVVRAYKEAIFNEWYNGERDTWMDDMFFPALGDVLVVDASEPVCQNQFWQAVWVPTTGERKFVHPAVLARIHFTAQYLGLDHFDGEWDSTVFFLRVP